MIQQEETNKAAWVGAAKVLAVKVAQLKAELGRQKHRAFSHEAAASLLQTELNSVKAQRDRAQRKAKQLVRKVAALAATDVAL